MKQSDHSLCNNIIVQSIVRSLWKTRWCVFAADYCHHHCHNHHHRHMMVFTTNFKITVTMLLWLFLKSVILRAFWRYLRSSEKGLKISGLNGTRKDLKNLFNQQFKCKNFMYYFHSCLCRGIPECVGYVTPLVDCDDEGDELPRAISPYFKICFGRVAAFRKRYASR